MSRAAGILYTVHVRPCPTRFTLHAAKPQAEPSGRKPSSAENFSIPVQTLRSLAQPPLGDHQVRGAESSTK